jgi:hypothetical protein
MNKPQTNGWGAYQNKKKEIDNLKKQIVIQDVNNYGEVITIDKNDNFKTVCAKANPFRFPNKIKNEEINQIIDETVELKKEGSNYEVKFKQNATLIEQLFNENTQNKIKMEEQIQQIMDEYEKQLAINNNQIQKLEKYNKILHGIMELHQKLENIDVISDIEVEEIISDTKIEVKESLLDVEIAEPILDVDVELEEPTSNIIPATRSVLDMLQTAQKNQIQPEIQPKMQNINAHNNIIPELNVFKKIIAVNHKNKLLYCLEDTNVDFLIRMDMLYSQGRDEIFNHAITKRFIETDAYNKQTTHRFITLNIDGKIYKADYVYRSTGYENMINCYTNYELYYLFIITSKSVMSCPKLKDKSIIKYNDTVLKYINKEKYIEIIINDLIVIRIKKL